MSFEILPTARGLVKAWVKGVPVEEAARKQLANVAAMPFIFKHVAVMPDVHWGMGATVGSVIATKGAVVPAAVSVDIGCGMMAQKTSLSASDLPDNLFAVRSAIEAAVPHGRTDNGGANDRGAWGDPASRPAVAEAWGDLAGSFGRLNFDVGRQVPARHLGTLGTGNHFIEICLDESDGVWVMLHSGSRGIGNRIGSHFIELAKRDMERFFIQLPDSDLAYLVEGSEHFEDYCRAVSWAQRYAEVNRRLMMDAAIGALRKSIQKPFTLMGESAVNVHHNYIAREHHFGENVWVTRKGAVRARSGDLGIIPGSMGAKSFIVRGKGNPDSFCSCSHGAGRSMSRGEAKRRFSLEDHAKATAGVECRKDEGVIDETPAAYKSIEQVMSAQESLVEIVHTLRQVVCVKG